jgi:hypothetical protein
MARMATGVAAQNFSPISNINYDTLSQYQALGSQMELQASQAKNDRVREGLQEAEKNRLLNQQNTGKIAGLLNSNPELMKQIDSGVAPKAVTQALKSYERGGGNLNSTALLANYLSSSAEQIQNQKVLDIAEYQKTATANTGQLRAEAALLEQQNKANQPTPVRLDNVAYQQFLNNNPDRNFNVKPVNVGGNILNELGSERFSESSDSGSFMTVAQYNKLVSENKGSSFKRTPVTDANGNVIGYNVEESYADTDEKTYEDIFMEKSAEQDAKNLSDRKNAVNNWYADKRPKVESNIQVYDSIIRDLKAGNISIGGIAEFVPDMGGFRDSTRAFFNSSNQDAVDRVRLVVYQSLKAILGGQFSKDEANRLAASAYNPQLSGTEGIEDNILRLEMANQVLKDMQAVKMAEFNAYQAGQQYFGPSAEQILLNGNDTMTAQFPIGSKSGTAKSGNTYGGLESVNGDEIKVRVAK